MAYTVRMRALYALGALCILAGAFALFVHPDVMPRRDNGTNAMPTTSLTLTSDAFDNAGALPARYTCDGAQISVPLAIAGVPDGTRSLALIADDPDIPQQVKDTMHIDVFDHWVLFNIPPETRHIGEGESPGIAGTNSAGTRGYTPPCPPSAYTPAQHRYFFKLYALDILLPLEEGASKAEVEAAMEGHLLASAELMATYERQ